MPTRGTEYFALSSLARMTPGAASLYLAAGSASDCTLNAAPSPGVLYLVCSDVDAWFKVAGNAPAVQYVDEYLPAKTPRMVLFMNEDLGQPGAAIAPPVPHFYMSAAGHLTATPRFEPNYVPPVAALGLGEIGLAVDLPVASGGRQTAVPGIESLGAPVDSAVNTKSSP